MSTKNTPDVRVSHDEPFTFLSDRWGSPLPRSTGTRLTGDDRNAVKRLAKRLWDEVGFVVKRGAEYGILVELEYDDNEVATEQRVGTILSSFASRCSELVAEGLAPFFTQGDHVFNSRYALRFFVPEDKATKDKIERIGEFALGALY